MTLNGSEYLYNSLSNTLIELDCMIKETVDSLKNGNIKACDVKDKELINDLEKVKVLVENDEDELYSLHYNANLYRYNPEKIYLTIAPTQDCNFDCTYCYESDRPSIYMSEDVENGIIDYLNASSVKLMNLVWFGGEPLLAVQTIESLYQKIKELNIKIDESFIITNGFLLELDVFKRLLDCQITDFQITIDGIEEYHNARRPLKGNGDTFSTIVRNVRNALDYCVKSNIKVRFYVRVNIDKTNKMQFFEVKKMFSDYSSKLITIHPGLTKDHSCMDASCMATKEFVDFHLDIFKELGVRLMDFYPNNILTECFTRHLTSYLIGADGKMYKCWHDLGNPSKEIGNIIRYKEVDSLLLSKYVLGTDPYLDKKCTKCKYMPICGGGCPLERYMNKYEGMNIDTCTIYKSRLQELLNTHLQTKKFGA